MAKAAPPKPTKGGKPPIPPKGGKGKGGKGC